MYFKKTRKSRNDQELERPKKVYNLSTTSCKFYNLFVINNSPFEVNNFF